MTTMPTMPTPPHLAAIGFGYVAEVLARQIVPKGWQVTGTSRTPDGAAAITAKGCRGIVWNADTADRTIGEAMEGVSHVLVSAPPLASGDPLVDRLAMLADGLRNLRWVGYLSTVGVYGDHGGGWVEEVTPATPTSQRARWRLSAEHAWQAFGQQHGCVVDVLRLPGIYGPGRSAFERLRAGTARRIVKPGQVFNRIHVDDIAGAIQAAIETHESPSRIFNLADDLPAPPQDVIAYAATVMGRVPPPEIAMQDAALSAMAASFYAENKRVSNRRMKDELGYRLRYPTYREGLAAIWAEIQNGGPQDPPR